MNTTSSLSPRSPGRMHAPGCSTVAFSHGDCSEVCAQPKAEAFIQAAAESRLASGTQIMLAAELNKAEARTLMTLHTLVISLPCNSSPLSANDC